MILNRFAADILARSHDSSASVNLGQMLQELDSLPHHGLIEEVLVDRLREKLERARADANARQDSSVWTDIARTIIALRKAMEESEKRGLPAQMTEGDQ